MSSGCKVDLCNDPQDTQSGIIEGLVAVQYSGAEGETAHIRDDSTFQAFFAPFNQSLPSVDFDTHDVLLLVTGASGCSQYYELNVEKREADKVYVATVKVNECGGCEPWVVVNHVLKVPKLPADYQGVEFNIE